jgi:hypothetical protein
MRFVATLLALFVPSLVLAQDMDQGEARITARSDVRMEISTAPGTPRAELQTLGGAVGQRLSAIRACYAERVGENPSVRGSLVMRISPARNGRASAAVTRDQLEDAPLRSCTVDAVEAASVAGARTTSAIVVTFTFANSAAEGHEQMQEHSARAASVTLETTADGKLVARGGVESGEVRYQVIGPAGRREAITVVHGAMRTAIPGLLDCRRRATRRGDSPAGEVRAQLTVDGTGRGRVGRTESTVIDPRSGRCLQNVLVRARFGREARGRYTIVVENAPLPTETADVN